MKRIVILTGAGFVMLARASKARTVEINLDESVGTSLFEEHRRGKAGELVPRLVEDILAATGVAG